MILSFLGGILFAALSALIYISTHVRFVTIQWGKENGSSVAVSTFGKKIVLTVSPFMVPAKEGALPICARLSPKDARIIADELHEAARAVCAFGADKDE